MDILKRGKGKKCISVDAYIYSNAIKLKKKNHVFQKVTQP